MEMGTGKTRVALGFYLTYKELKQLKEAQEWAEKYRFYLTYKELKHKYLALLSNPTIMVFILPIRN